MTRGDGVAKRLRISGRTRRTMNLHSSGFKSYRQYLRSPLWAEIRAEKLAENPWCECCNRRATQVHHKSYFREDLDGIDRSSLVSLCRSCHFMIEFTKSGKKRSQRGANSRLISLRRYYRAVERRERNRPHPWDTFSTRQDREAARQLIKECLHPGPLASKRL